MRSLFRWLTVLVVTLAAAACAPNHPPPKLICEDCEAACHVCAGLSCLSADAGYSDARCGAYVCHADAGCFTSCSGPSECQADAFCDAGSCEAYRPPGTTCSGAAECQSRHCSDGVCCESACDQACDRCDLPGLAGSCQPAPAGSAGAPTCAPYVCAGAVSCPTSCAVDTACAAGSYCSGGACVPGLGAGATCARDPMCGTGHCVDGVCCDSACAGACDSCAQPGAKGTCTRAAPGSSGAPSCAPYVCTAASTACPTSCAGDSDCDTAHFCGSAGSCLPVFATGQACARAAQCSSGFCADGVCCGTACTASCGACNLAGAVGACGVADAGMPGRPSCAPYACGGAGAACPASCTTNAQCATGQACNGSACTPDGDRDGTADAVDCAPTDATKWANRTCYRDQDTDGFVSATGTSVCAGAACPAGTQSTPGTDCNDADSAVYQLVTCYGGADADTDGFHAGAGVSTCSGAQCPTGTSSIRDCYDSNPDAKPGQYLTFAVHRGDGSFDYDCDGAETKDTAWACVTSFAGIAACSTMTFSGNRGYVGAVPACGVSGTWRTCAVFSNGTCTGTYNFGSCGAGCFPTGGVSFSVEETPYKMKCR